MPKVIVFGSMNMDLSIDAPRIPAVGETLSGSGFITAAIAVSRRGAQPSIPTAEEVGTTQ